MRIPFLGKKHPTKVEVMVEGQPVVTFTADRKVLIAGDIHEAASAFWQAVRTIVPKGWFVEVQDDA